jgi:hypothetical protein
MILPLLDVLSIADWRARAFPLTSIETSNGPANAARFGFRALVAPTLHETPSLSSNASNAVIEPKQSIDEVNDVHCIDKIDVTSNPMSPKQ